MMPEKIWVEKSHKILDDESENKTCDLSCDDEAHHHKMRESVLRVTSAVIEYIDDTSRERKRGQRGKNSQIFQPKKVENIKTFQWAHTYGMIDLVLYS